MKGVDQGVLGNRRSLPVVGTGNTVPRALLVLPGPVGPNFAYEFRSAAEEDPPKRADGYAYHAAASRRVRISDGPSLWEEGQVVFVPPQSQPGARTSPLFDFSSLGGGRAQGGPGEAGTGSSVSAPG
jgi:hypothetical protein